MKHHQHQGIRRVELLDGPTGIPARGGEGFKLIGIIERLVFKVIIDFSPVQFHTVSVRFE